MEMLQCFACGVAFLAGEAHICKASDITARSYDPAHNPSHYHQDKGIDPIGVMELTFHRDELVGFYKGNMLKYAMRYQDKNGIEDLRKVIDYAERLIKLYEK